MSTKRTVSIIPSLTGVTDSNNRLTLGKNIGIGITIPATNLNINENEKISSAVLMLRIEGFYTTMTGSSNFTAYLIDKNNKKIALKAFKLSSIQSAMTIPLLFDVGGFLKETLLGEDILLALKIDVPLLGTHYLNISKQGELVVSLESVEEDQADEGETGDNESGEETAYELDIDRKDSAVSDEINKIISLTARGAEYSEANDPIPNGGFTVGFNGYGHGDVDYVVAVNQVLKDLKDFAIENVKMVLKIDDHKRQQIDENLPLVAMVHGSDILDVFTVNNDAEMEFDVTKIFLSPIDNILVKIKSFSTLSKLNYILVSEDSATFRIKVKEKHNTDRTSITKTLKNRDELRIDLCDGNQVHEHVLLTKEESQLPFDITQIGSKHGIKLNIEQKLETDVKFGNLESDGKISRVIEANGESRIFVEKYFYYMGDKRIFVSKNDVIKVSEEKYEIKLEDKIHEVFKASIDENGNALVSSKEEDIDVGLFLKKFGDKVSEVKMYCYINDTRKEITIDDNIANVSSIYYFEHSGVFPLSDVAIRKDSLGTYFVCDGERFVVGIKDHKFEVIDKSNKIYFQIPTKYSIDNHDNAQIAEYELIEIFSEKDNISKHLPEIFKNEDLLMKIEELEQTNDYIKQIKNQLDEIEINKNDARQKTYKEIFNIKNILQDIYNEWNSFNRDEEWNKVKNIYFPDECEYLSKEDCYKYLNDALNDLVISTDFVLNEYNMSRIVESKDCLLRPLSTGLNYNLPREVFLPKLNACINSFNSKLAYENEQIQNDTIEKQKTRISKELEKYQNIKKKLFDDIRVLWRKYSSGPVSFILNQDENYYGYDSKGSFITMGNKKEETLRIIYDDKLSEFGVISTIYFKNEKFVTFSYENNQLNRVKAETGKFVELEMLANQIKYNHNNKYDVDITWNGETLRVSNNEHYLEASNLFYDPPIIKGESCHKFLKVGGLITSYNSQKIDGGEDIYLEEYDIHFISDTVTKVENLQNKLVQQYIFNHLGEVVSTFNYYLENDRENVEDIAFNAVKRNIGNKTIEVKQTKVDIIEPITFENGINDWISSAGTVANIASNQHFTGSKSLEIVGGINKKASVSKNITLNKFPINKAFSVSVWAKADAMIMNDICIINEPAKSDEGNVTKFTLRVETKFKKRSQIFVSEAGFDALTSDWQLLSVPVSLRFASELSDIVSVKIVLKYEYNNGNVYFDDLHVGECSYSLIEVNDEGVVVYQESENERTYYLNLVDKKPTISLTFDNDGEKYHNYFSYGENGQLVKEENHLGIIKEYLFDEKNKKRVIKTYHKDEPANSIYEENIFDENGRKIKESTSRGGYRNYGLYNNYEYHQNSDLVRSYQDGRGNKTYYGYDEDNRLINITSSVNDEECSTSIKYAGEYICRMRTGDNEYTYSYDTRGRLLNFNINNQEYLNSSFEEIDFEDVTVTTYGTAEQFVSKVSKDKKSNVIIYNGEMLQEISKLDHDTYEIKDYLNKAIYLIDEESVDCRTLDASELIYRKTVNPHIHSVNYEINNCGTIKEYTYITHYDNLLDQKIKEYSINESTKQLFDYDLLNRVKKICISENDNNLLEYNYKYLKAGDYASNIINKVTRFVSEELEKETNYKYDEIGNIIEILQNGETTHRYKYDSVSRLVREDNKVLNLTNLFSYDCNGNILSKTCYGFANGKLIDKFSGNKHVYTYDKDNQDRLIDFNGEKCTYDKIGNPKIYRDKTLTWSHLRDLINYGPVTFTYGANHMRTSKNLYGNISKYVYDGNNLIFETRSDGTTIAYFYGAEGILGFEYCGEKYFYGKSLQGDVDCIYNKDGKIIVKYEYDGWGNVRTINGNEKNIGDINAIRYRGYYFDVETNLYYLKSRYYDPETGRFINADDISYLDPETINGLNLYAYCRNNPIRFKDEMGRFPNSDSDAYELLAAALEFSIGFVYAFKAFGINQDLKTATWPPYITKYTNELTALNNTLKIVQKAATVLAVIGIAISTIENINSDIKKGYSTGRIVSNAIVNTVVNSISTFGFAALGSKIGGVIGSFIPIPGVGTAIGMVIGAVIGYGVGLVFNAVMNLKIGGKSIMDHIRDGFYNFWKSIFR